LYNFLVPTTGTKKKLADLGAVASGLAHEIRNPLNSLYINSQLLVEMLSALSDSDKARKEELLSMAQSNLKVIQRLNDLLADFLRFARRFPHPTTRASFSRFSTAIN